MIAKTPEQLAIQKAIVCLYLRKRQTRKYLHEAKSIEFLYHDNWKAKLQLEMAIERNNEAYNALESIKRVLWHNNWD